MPQLKAKYTVTQILPLASADVADPAFKAQWVKCGSPYDFTITNDAGGTQDYTIAAKAMSFDAYKKYIAPELEKAKNDRSSLGQRVSEAVSDEWWFGVFALKKIFNAAKDVKRPVLHNQIEQVEKMITHFEKTNTQMVVLENANVWYGRADRLEEGTIVLNTSMGQVYPAPAKTAAQSQRKTP